MPLLPVSHFSFSSASSAKTPLPPPGTHLLVTDTLNASADFVIYHLVIEALRVGRPPSTGPTKSVLVVDFSGGRKSAGHWEAIGKKLGAPIPLKSSESFSSITPSAHTFPSTLPAHSSPSLYTDDDEPTLQNVYRTVTESIMNGSGSLVVLDDLSELLVLGFSPQEVTRFVRAITALARKHNSIVVSHLHADSLSSSSAIASFQPNSREQSMSPDLDLLLRIIRLGGGVWWRIEGLRTGRSGVVTGEISSHPLLPLPIDPRTSATCSVPMISRSHPLQYRMDDNSVKTFAKGTGEGYL